MGIFVYKVFRYFVVFFDSVIECCGKGFLEIKFLFSLKKWDVLNCNV